MNLTDRDQFVVSTLVHRGRAIEELQFVDALWPPTDGGRKNGQRRLRALSEADLVNRHLVHVKSVRRVELLCAGGPDEPEPDCGELSRQCRSAWRALPIRPAVVYTATRRARLIFGGLERHRVHALPQLSHDLACSAVYFDLLRRDPTLAERWRSEDEGLMPAGFGDCQPDAVLVDDTGQPAIAVEFAADYGQDRFDRLTRTFSEQGLQYLIYGAQP